MAQSVRTPTTAEADERIALVKAVFDAYASMSLATVLDGEPWAGKVFFVEDEPEPGRFDICCAMILTSRKTQMLRESPRAAFVVGGDLPDRWVQGIGTAEVVDDAAECAAIAKRLAEKCPESEGFLDRVSWSGVRLHVERLKLTDVSADPPVAEFTFS